MSEAAVAEKPLKAFVVLEHDDRTGDIYFARHRITAHKAGANEYGDGELRRVECRRAPEFDSFAAECYVPWKVRIAHGWWIECIHCGQKICEDAYDADGNDVEFDIIEANGHVFCNPACHSDWLSNRAEVCRIRANVIGWMTDKLLRAMPGAIVLDPADQKRNYVSVSNDQWPLYPREASIAFRFPGDRYTSTFKWRIGEKNAHAWIARGDQAAFYRWQDAGYPPHMMDAQE